MRSFSARCGGWWLMAEFDDVKVGDQVVISNRHNTLRLASVEKVTKTQFIAGGVRFTRYGREVGADSWSFSTVQQATTELVARVHAEQRYNKTTNALQQLGNMIETRRRNINQQHDRTRYIEKIEAALEHMRAAVNCLCLDQEEP